MFRQEHKANLAGEQLQFYFGLTFDVSFARVTSYEGLYFPMVV